MRYYSSQAGAMTLSADISAASGTITVSTVVGLPTSYPYTLVLDAGNATEEIVDVTAASGTTLTVTRGADGSTGQSHSMGAPVRHMLTARDPREAQQHIAGTSGVHGVSGSVVGTSDTQVLDKKTFQSADGAGVPVRVKAQTGQSANLLEVQSAGGTNTWTVDSSGGALISDATIIRNGASANFWKRVADFIAPAKDVVGILVKGFSGQTADLQQWQKSDGTVLAKVDASGNLTAANYTDSGVITSGVVTAASGFTVTLQRLRKMGKVAELYVELTSTNALAAGDITNVLIATLPGSWGCDYIVGVSPGASGPVWAGYLNSSGEVRVTATATGIPAGGPMSFSATYLIP